MFSMICMLAQLFVILLTFVACMLHCVESEEDERKAFHI